MDELDRMIAERESDADPLDAAIAEREDGFAPLRAAGQAVVGAASAVGEAVRGEKGPGFENIGGLDLSNIRDPEVLSAINRAKVGAPDDKRFGELVKRALGPRIFRTQLDEVSGQEVLTYQDDDGNIKQGFINEPGLDVEDVSRGIQSSLPFLAAGGAVGAGVRGAGLLARTAAQAAGQTGASIGQDIAAGDEGQRLSGIDPFKAAVAALGGAGGELTFAAWQALKGAFSRAPGLVDDAGLTEQGRVLVEQAGIDPNAVTPEFLTALQAPDISRSGADVTAAIRAQQDQFNIPSSVGARTGDPTALSIEQGARRGLMGQEAREVARQFDTGQRMAAARAVEETAGGLGTPGGLPPRTPGEAGETILRGLTGAQETAETAISRAFGDVDVTKVFPEGIPSEAFDDLATRLQAELGPIRATRLGSTGQFPSATAAVEFLDDFAEGRARQANIGLLRRGQAAEPGVLDFDSVRRELIRFVNQTDKVGQDFAASVAVKKAYNDWVENLAKTAVKNADTDEFLKLQGAIGLTAQTKALFQQQGKNDTAGRIIQNVINKADSPEGVVREIFGASVKGPPKAGSVGALKRMKTILEKEDPDAWHAIRQAYWNRLARKKILSQPGELDRRSIDTAFGQVARNVDDAFENQRSLLDVLYTPQELRRIKAFGTSMKKAQAMDLNPSGTAMEAQRFRNAARDNVTVNFLKRRAASAQLQGNPANAVLFRIMARHGTSIFGARAAGQQARRAERLFSPRLGRQRLRPSAGRGGAIAVQEENRER